jgi:hypothetical protein
MAAAYKIQITVKPGSRSEDITWRAIGYFGQLNLSTISGVVHNSVLTSLSTAEEQVAAILAKVSPLV